MRSPAEWISRLDAQDALLAELKSKLDKMVDDNASRFISHECKVPYKHECYFKDCTSQEGQKITLWAYMEWPESRARRHSLRVKFFKQLKAKSRSAMGNGPSPLRLEVKLKADRGVTGEDVALCKASMGMAGSLRVLEDTHRSYLSVHASHITVYGSRFSKTIGEFVMRPWNPPEANLDILSFVSNQHTFKCNNQPSHS